MLAVEDLANEVHKLGILADLPDFLSSGARLADLLAQDSEQTTQQLDALYAYGYGLYQQQKYADAASMFAFLAMQDHLEVRYWCGLAGAQQAQGLYRKAIESYGMVIMYALGDPLPCYRVAECLLALGEYDDVELVLKTVVEFANTESEAHSAIKRRAAGVSALLQSAREKARCAAAAGAPATPAGT